MARIYTAKYLVPVDAPPIVGGALFDLDGEISDVGPLHDLQSRNPGVEVVDFEDAIITPLLVNAHTHLELTDYPAWATSAGESTDPVAFVDWILRLIRIKRTLNKKKYSQSLANGIQQSLAAGTGAVGDILSQYASRKAYRGTDLYGTLFLECLGHDPAIINKFKQELRVVLAEEKIGKVTLGLSPHSPYTIGAEYLNDIYGKCRRQGLSCTTHLAESAEEVDFVEASRGDLAERFYPYVGWEYLLPKASGQRPTQYLQQQGGLFPGNLLVHGVQLDTAEINLLAKNSVFLALCPRSNAKLQVGKAPAAQLLAAGVRLCLGTDSLASNDSLSVWDELAFAQDWFEGAIDPKSLLRMATLGGAEALGLEDSLGSLQVGKMSSFQVLKLKTTVAENEMFEYLTAPGRSADIVQVYQQGRAKLSGIC